MPRRFPWLAAACLCACVSAANTVHASSFDISPISVTLSTSVPSAMLTVRNRGTEAIRFHIAAFSWAETAKGEMELKPTSDIVFFPAMLVLSAGEARKLRVGMNIPPGPIERSYRIFVQELPALAKKGEEGTAVRMLTKMGVPVFVQGASPKPQPKITDVKLEGSTVKIGVSNTGNAHFRTDKLIVKSMSGTRVLHKHEVPGWYVLAGYTRQYVVNLPREGCEGLESLEIELVLADRTVRSGLADARCAP